MINSFVVKAIPSSNLLKVNLDGIFMKSEIELALLLIKTEKLKLREGFKVLIDLSNFQPKGAEFQSIHFKIQQLLKTNLYCEKVLNNESGADYSYRNVG